MLFFIVIIFLGSYYLVNLILAIVAMSYDELQKKAEEEEMANAAEEEAIREEEEARAAKIASMEASEYARAHPGECRKSPSGFSEKSFEDWGGQGDDGGLKERIGSEFNVLEGNLRGSHSRLPPMRRNRVDASVSLPGSPYNNRRASRDKLMVLSTYMDAQEHLPYADDSTAATPMSEENGAIILPFMGNGVHHQSHGAGLGNFGGRFEIIKIIFDI